MKGGKLEKKKLNSNKERFTGAITKRKPGEEYHIKEVERL